MQHIMTKPYILIPILQEFRTKFSNTTCTLSTANAAEDHAILFETMASSDKLLPWASLKGFPDGCLVSP